MKQAHYWELFDARRQEARRRWLELWQESFQGDKMQTHRVDLAAVMTQCGTMHAICLDRDYTTALEFLDTLFSHPAIGKLDSAYSAQLRCYRMLCLFQLGREAQAIDVGRSLLAIERRSDLRHALIFMHNSLAFLPNRDPGQMASVLLTEFVWDAAQARRVRARRNLPSPATYAQLCEVWIQSFPPKDREAYKERWSAKL